MDRIAISVFDSNYFEYAVRMYVSLRAFNPDLTLFAGDIGLSRTQRNMLEALGVPVLQTDRAAILKERGLHPAFGDFLLHSFLRDFEWSQVAWIDADTMVLDDLSELFSYDVDVVGHPGRSIHGPLLKLREVSEYWSPGAKEWISKNLSWSGASPHLAGGVWCTRSRALLKFLDSLLDIIPPYIFPGEDSILSVAILHLGLSFQQLDPRVWGFSRELVRRAVLRDGKITYDDGILPKTAAFSSTDDGTRPSSVEIDRFYDEVVRRKRWKRPLDALINYLIEDKYTQLPADKLESIDELVTDVVMKDLPGDLVECGTWRGGSAVVILNAAWNCDKVLHLFDTFKGMPPPSKKDFKGALSNPEDLREEGGSFGRGSNADTPVGLVRSLFDRMGMDLSRLKINKARVGERSALIRYLNRFLEALRPVLAKRTQIGRDLLSRFPETISFLHINVGFYDPYRWLLYHLYRRIPHGGIIVFDDYGHRTGAKRAVDEFLKESGETLHTTATTQSFVVKTQNIYVDLDDFCEEYMTSERWQLLGELRRIYPDFKVTMFAIPGKSSPMWLRRVKKEYSWIEMAVHGTKHEDPSEWLASGKEALQRFRWVYNDEIYAKGFKAPWWKLSKEAYDALREAGFWVATNKTNPFAKLGDTLNYKYDDGDELLPDVHYRHAFFDAWHGHVQTQRAYGAPVPNGLEDVFDLISKAWDRQSRFHFVSERFNA